MHGFPPAQTVGLKQILPKSLSQWNNFGLLSAYENGSYKILGRTSVDIIKSGGYKIRFVTDTTLDNFFEKSEKLFN